MERQEQRDGDAHRQGDHERECYVAPDLRPLHVRELVAAKFEVVLHDVSVIVIGLGVGRCHLVVLMMTAALILGELEKRPQRLECDVSTAKPRVQHKQDEVPIVHVADAIEHPGAVVIHVQHELLRHVVIVRARRLWHVCTVVPAPFEWTAVHPATFAASILVRGRARGFLLVNLALCPGVHDQTLVLGRVVRARVGASTAVVVEENVEAEPKGHRYVCPPH